MPNQSLVEAVVEDAVAVEVEAVVAAEIGVLDVAFETDHERADLVVVAELGAADEAAVVVDGRTSGRRR